MLLTKLGGVRNIMFLYTPFFRPCVHVYMRLWCSVRDICGEHWWWPNHCHC